MEKKQNKVLCDLRGQWKRSDPGNGEYLLCYRDQIKMKQTDLNHSWFIFCKGPGFSPFLAIYTERTCLRWRVKQLSNLCSVSPTVIQGGHPTLSAHHLLRLFYTTSPHTHAHTVNHCRHGRSAKLVPQNTDALAKSYRRSSLLLTHTPLPCRQLMQLTYRCTSVSTHHHPPPPSTKIHKDTAVLLASIGDQFQ